MYTEILYTLRNLLLARNKEVSQYSKEKQPLSSPFPIVEQRIVKVSVTNPTIRLGGIFGRRQFTAYEITVHIWCPFSCKMTNVVVHKRYSVLRKSYEKLQALLLVTTPNSRLDRVRLPSLPGKQMHGRFTNRFIEQRRRALQTFLWNIAQLITIKEFLQFLGEDLFDDMALSTTNHNKPTTSSHILSINPRMYAAAIKRHRRHLCLRKVKPFQVIAELRFDG
ncbi:853_t:CDS:2 [Ambispora gerdemannii]|uniref:Sorting nexin-3 n=1 Tax=Ambispora gerdemannii TaxID=144530 RepID=A0A9N9G4W2_9GLOM|nr:853_t:CDS:2 [Ambispora gerdemannii]